MEIVKGWFSCLELKEKNDLSAGNCFIFAVSFLVAIVVAHNFTTVDFSIKIFKSFFCYFFDMDDQW